jgi:hypothetical protein
MTKPNYRRNQVQNENEKEGKQSTIRFKGNLTEIRYNIDDKKSKLTK